MPDARVGPHSEDAGDLAPPGPGFERLSSTMIDSAIADNIRPYDALYDAVLARDPARVRKASAGCSPAGYLAATETTLLHMAVSDTRNPSEITAALLDAAAPPNAPSVFGDT